MSFNEMAESVQVELMAVKEELPDMAFNSMTEGVPVEHKALKEELPDTAFNQMAEGVQVEQMALKEELPDTQFNQLVEGVEQKPYWLNMQDAKESDKRSQTHCVKIEVEREDSSDRDHLHIKKEFDCNQMSEITISPYWLNMQDAKESDKRSQIHCVKIEVEREDSSESSFQATFPGIVPNLSVQRKWEAAEIRSVDLKADGVNTDNKQKIHVYMSKNTVNKRVWDKTSFCKFCGKSSTNLTKHVLGVHKYEPDVVLILSKQKGSEERQHLLEKLRNYGNYVHNCTVLREGKGILVPFRSPSEKVDPAKYVPCEFCLAFFVKKELWRHQHTCKFKPNSTKRGRKVISRAQQLLPADVTCSEGGMRKVFSAMSADEISLVARNDPLIVVYGEKLFQADGHLQHRQRYIRQKLRQLARFLIVARKECSEISNLESCMDPEKFHVVISAVRRLCGYNSLENNYSNPSFALKLRNALKSCALTMRNVSLMKGDFTGQNKAENVHLLCESDWQSYISSAALSTLQTRKWNVPHVLPLTQDIQVLSQYLLAERSQQLEQLRSKSSVECWHALAKACLASIILFNRRRSGEAARMLRTDFEAAKVNTVPADDVLASLTDLEKQLMKSFIRVEILGKRGRKVPILLTPDMVKEIDQLCSTRSDVQVSSLNPYIFSRPYFNSEDHMAGHECLRVAAIKSGLKKPENVTSTKLHKHVGTVYQILNLTDHELDQLCVLMGHDVRIHREFYRLPENTLQLAKVSRLLLAMEQGGISDFKGKSLNDINVSMQFQDSEVEEDSGDETESQLHLDSIQEEQFCPELESQSHTLSDTPVTTLKKRKTCAKKVKTLGCKKKNK